MVKHKNESQAATYYYATDHLGSSSVLTNSTGIYHECIEYLPYGEVWIEDSVNSNGYTTPYKFTGKELDKETGLYYFGARYYDARLSRWISTDPALEKYIPKPNDYDTEHDFYWYILNDASGKLPGMGGVYNDGNLDVYCYSLNNPVKYVDPDGETIFAFEYNSNKQYGSIILVWNGIIPDGIFVARTRSDKGDPAVKTGIYTYNVSNHGPNYFAKHKALKIKDDLAVPTQKANPKHGGKNIATGIRIHVGNKMVDNNEGRTGSAGCWVIPAVVGTKSEYNPKDSNTWSYYNNFISSFKEGDVGVAVLLRAGDIKEFLNNIFKRDYK